MNENIFYSLCGLVLTILIIAALFSGPRESELAGEFPTETESQRGWQSAPRTPGWGPDRGGPVFPAAFPQAPPIQAGETAPELIKELGIEVVEISGGKVKITGVMGNSWADKAGLQRKDIILSFDHKRTDGLKGFRTLVQQAAPERDYRVRILRGDRVKSLLVTVGEGEMEGFAPIAAAAFSQPLASGMPGAYGCRCPNCGNIVRPVCPYCRTWLNPMR